MAFDSKYNKEGKPILQYCKLCKHLFIPIDDVKENFRKYHVGDIDRYEEMVSLKIEDSGILMSESTNN